MKNRDSSVVVLRPTTLLSPFNVNLTQTSHLLGSFNSRISFEPEQRDFGYERLLRCAHKLRQQQVACQLISGPLLKIDISAFASSESNNTAPSWTHSPGFVFDFQAVGIRFFRGSSEQPIPSQKEGIEIGASMPVVQEVITRQVLENRRVREPGLLRTMHLGMHRTPENTMDKRCDNDNHRCGDIEVQRNHCWQCDSEQFGAMPDREVQESARLVLVVKYVVARSMVRHVLAERLVEVFVAC
jgi:hypothetical protein